MGRATNGDETLAAVLKLKPDVLVTDIEMPSKSGIELVAALAERQRPTRTIIVTTFARAGYLRRALEAGIRGYLLKDTPDDVLAAAIREVAAGRRAVDPALASIAWEAGSHPLTPRERAVLRYADAGYSTAAIARSLSLTSGTVRNYLSEALQKLDAPNRTEAARVARDNGWL